MSVSHVSHDEPTRVDVWTVLKELPQRVQALLKRHEASQELGFEELEHEFHALFTHAECAATSEALERHDVDLPHVFIDAEKHHRAYRCEKTYLCAVGPVTAMRTLYRARPGERAVAAMERKVGIVEGYWTPHAARQGAMLTAHLVPREAEEVLGVLGNMTPSKSSLDRLPKALSARWEAQRPQFEARVREETLEVADTACTVAVSLDGVMAPMKTGGGYREASCASVSLYDGEGERLSTVRMARMPESKKVTLKTMVGAEVEAVLGQPRTCNWSRLPTQRTTTGRSSVACCPRASSSSTSSTPRSISAMPSMRPMEPMTQGGGAVREVSPSAALRRRRCRAGDSGIAPSAFEASRVRTYRASPGLLPQPSTPHGLCRGRRARDCYRLRGGGGDMQDLGH